MISFFPVVVRGVVFTVVLLLLVSSFSTLAAGEPTWTNQNDYTLQVPQLPVNIYISEVTELHPAQSTDGISEYQRKRQEFMERFARERESKEAEYSDARGEDRINKALGLINFILEMQKEWDQLQYLIVEEWQGTHQINVEIREMFEITTKVILFLEVEIEQSAENEQPEVKARITGGEGTGSAQLGVGGGAAEMEYQETAVDGYFAEGKLCLEMPYSPDSSYSTQLAVPFAYSEGRGTTEGGVNSYSGTTWVINPLDRNIEQIPYSDSNDYGSQTYLMSLSFSGWDEQEPDFQKYLNQYFKEYVKSIDLVREDQFSGSAEQKMTKALATLNELLAADAMGHSMGLGLGVIEETGLIVKYPGSLYDKWFKRWFNQGKEYWLERIEDDNQNIFALRERFNFLLGAIHQAEFLISGQLIQQLETYFQSSLVDSWYGEYFGPALEDWIDRISSGTVWLSEALDWLEIQTGLVAGAIISPEKADRLGLIGNPCQAEEQILSAAEEVE